MINSIWHKANEKPELNKYVVVRKHGFAQWKVFKFDNKTTFFEPFTDDLWAYMADVITQADKVELQADKVERLQKTVFFLSGHLRDVLQLDEYGHIKLDEITKQQIKTAISDPVGIIMQLEQESNNLKGVKDDD